MWKYTQTDEMFVKRNNGELYHSDIYLGKDFSDGIRHYKYIKKIQKNGHTYYIYDDSELKSNEEKAREAGSEIGRIGKYTDKDRYEKTVKNPYEQNPMLYGTGSRFKVNGGKDQTADDIKKEKYVEKAYRMIDNHIKQKIKDIPRRLHARGISAISKMLMLFRGDL